MSSRSSRAVRRESQDSSSSPASNDKNADKKDDGEKGGSEDEKPTPVGFWDPALKHVRLEAMRKWVYTTTVLMAFILAVLSMYWAVFFHLPRTISSCVVYIVDFDGMAPYNTRNTPLVGPLVSQLGQQMLQVNGHPGYGSLPPSDFNNDPMQVRQAVYDQKAWAAFIINANATAMLYSAIESGNASYDPMGAMQMVFIDARDDTTWYDYLAPQIDLFMTEAVAQINQEWAKLALQRAAADPTILANLQAAPQALQVGFSQYNLRPFYPYTATPTVSIGLIYLIIVSFFSFSFYLPIHLKYLKPEGHPPLKFYQLILWRWIATISAYFMLSLAYSLLSLAFGLNFGARNPITSETEVTILAFGNPNAYGHLSFFVYWMLNFFGMIALGMACENMAMFVGQPWTGLWLIFWVISNVVSSFYNIGTEPGFFHWGYAWPLHSIVEGSRQILFDLKSNIAVDFGILIAWGVVNSLFFPLACWYLRYKNLHEVHEYWA